MMKRLLLVISAIFVLVSFFPGESITATGTVVYTRGDCDYFIAETWMGFALIELYGGDMPADGNIIVGDFENFGRTVVYNVTNGSEATVYVADFWLNRTQVVEEFAKYCPKTR